MALLWISRKYNKTLACRWKYVVYVTWLLKYSTETNEIKSNQIYSHKRNTA